MVRVRLIGWKMHLANVLTKIETHVGPLEILSATRNDLFLCSTLTGFDLPDSEALCYRYD